jgi:2',3'-cyclic-nucleotide 2'-phosphodiesterase/3'-nucleotidase/5'-nucleotidase
MVKWACSAGLVLSTQMAAFAVQGSVTDEPAQMAGLAGWEITPVLTVGEINESQEIEAPAKVGDYIMPGVIDGLGAFKLDKKTVRILANHEFRSDAGYPYMLETGAELTGGRISYIDVDRKTLEVLETGLAFDRIYNRSGKSVDSAVDLPGGGLQRLCSASYFGFGEFGLLDGLFFTGEESGGGTEFILDAENRNLWAAPALGRAAWENVTLINTGRWWETAVIVGDDREGAPLLLFLGTKKPWLLGPENVLARNGLDEGQLFVWVTESGTSPNDFFGLGNVARGNFVEIDYYRPDLAGIEGYDELGYATQEKQDELAAAAGAFEFSRPEDVATNPVKKNQIVLASTGGRAPYPGDQWGTIYKIKISVKRKWWLFGARKLRGDAKIIYNADQLSEPDSGIRSPDNLDWADDGYIYVQEDRSTADFGQTSGEEASIWQLSKTGKSATRIAQMDRTAVPAGQSDPVPTDIGNWESSGVLDVSKLFKRRAGTLLLGCTQAHSIRDGAIADEGLVEGGQLFFMYKEFDR